MRAPACVAVAIALAACGVTGCAFRDPTGASGFGNGTYKLPKFAEFEAADTDHSGKLSREEAEALPTVSHFFDAMDTDRSGEVSWAEVKNLDLGAQRRQRPIPEEDQPTQTPPPPTGP